MTSPTPATDRSVARAEAVTTGPGGLVAHRALIEHSQRLERRLWPVREGVWCLVGNGLANQTFIEGPEGLIAIDTGESVEEMAAAIAEVRAHTDAPIVAVIYTHFHYVAGTDAIYAAGAAADTPVWGHAGIVGNRRRYGMEMSPVAGRGLIQQFAIGMPTEGADAAPNVGLALSFRDPGHAPFTPGFVEPTHTFTEPTSATIAGLAVEFTPAPSDADDNITIHFPELSVCVNNIVWPTLFNVFAIRGEEYRDPRVLLTGIDHIHGLGAEHLVGAHGPPLSGADEIASTVLDYRDSIQFLWDQTVRGMNRGLTMDELTEFVRLPERFADSYFTSQFYGLAEHHVRQIFTGLRGWFDGDESALLPVPHVERHRRLIEGFGGAAAVRGKIAEAIAADDLRWALELATWLVRSDTDAAGRADAGTDEDRSQLAAILRTIAQRVTATNVRNWCLVRANELEGTFDLARHRTHRFSAGVVAANPPASSVAALRVILEPTRCEGLHTELRWDFTDAEPSGLRLRDGVAVPTDGSSADAVLSLDTATWAKVLGAKLSLADAIDSGAATTGQPDAVARFLACFDHPSFTRTPPANDSGNEHSSEGTGSR